jgi:PAS domain S-box-containing protein
MTFSELHSAQYCDFLFDTLFDAAFMLNAQGGLLRINSAFTALLDYEPDDIAALKFSDLAATLGPDSSVEPMLREQILRFEFYPLMLAEKRPSPCTLIARSGKRIPVILRSIIVRDSKGSILQAIGTASPEHRRVIRQDDDGQHNQFRDVWETEELYRNILENSGDAVIIADLNGWIATTNDACIRMFGYERPEEMLGRYLLEFIPVTGSYASSTGETFIVSEEYYARQIMNIEELYETGLAKTRGYLFKKDHTVFPVEATMSLLRDQQGQQRGTITICRDVTDTIIAERKIEQSQAFLENIFETIGDGLYVTDSLGAIRMVNRAFCDIVGYSEQELIKEAVHDLFYANPAPDDSGATESLAPAAGCPESRKSICRRKDGSLVHVELKLSMFSGPTGETAVGSLRDITERKQFEEQLRQAHDKLERTVQNRTQDLQEANTALRVLLNSRDEERLKLEKNIRTRAQELIMPYIEKLRTGSLNERQRAFLDIIEVNLRHITAPFESSKEAPNLLFTPMETQIANLVQYGRTTKDIAEALSVSTKTVAFHRNAIRRKLGIQNKKIGLRKYLLSRSS